MEIPVLITVVSIYVFWWLNGIFKVSFNEKTAQVLGASHGVLAILVLTSIVLASYQVYFRGFYTQEILIWSCLFSAMLMGGFGNHHIKYRLRRMYYRFMFFLPLRSSLLLLIPFLGVILLLNTYGSILVNGDDIYYEDDTIRVEQTFTGVLGAPHPPIVMLKQGIFEYKQATLSIPPRVFMGLNGLKVVKRSAKHYVLRFYYHSYDTDQKTCFLVDLSLN